MAIKLKEMNKLKVPFLKNLVAGNAEEIKGILINNGKQASVDIVNWVEYPHIPEVQFFVGHSGTHLWIHFEIKNDYIIAENWADQDPVWQDACVEFFMLVGNEYRNFEFNCLGVCLSAVGPNRNSRTSISKEDLVKIIRYPAFSPNNIPKEGTQADWSLTIGIPFDLTGLKAGMTFKGNFYKCGDETKIPHYLSWAPISTENPDFHRPEFFGEIELESTN
jgi:hypothetical protein